jgi:hypothetical protein
MGAFVVIPGRSYPMKISMRLGPVIAISMVLTFSGWNLWAESTRFSIQQQGSTSWLVRPNGERFFSLGVCCVTPGTSRREFDPSNPSYAAWQHYAN